MSPSLRRAADLARRAAPALVIASGVALRALWPGTTWFIGDEPRLLTLALDLWRDADPFRLGIPGTRGLSYGPVALWFFAPLVGLSLPLEIVVLVKSLASLAGVLVGLRWWFGGRPILLAVVVLATHAPYGLLYDRAPWDNPLVVPLCALGVGAYRRWLDLGRARWLGGAGLALAMAVATHPMSLPVLIGVSVHLSGYIVAWLRGRRPLPRAGLAAFAVGASPAIVYAVAAILARPEGAASSVAWKPVEALRALEGVRYFTFLDFSQFMGDPDALAPMLRALHLASSVLLVAAVAAVLAVLTDRRPWSERVRDPAIGLTCLILTLHVLIHAAFGLSAEPHYANGAWPALLAVMGLGATWLSRRTIGAVIVAAGLGSIVIGSWLTVVSLQITAGSSGWRFGPALSEQIAVARIAASWGVPVEAILSPPNPGGPEREALRFLVDYAGLGAPPRPTGPAPAEPLFVVRRFAAVAGEVQYMQLNIRDATGRILGP